MIKTNAMRILDKNKINYKIYSYNSSKAISGIEVAHSLKQNPDMVFKTLVTTAKSKVHYVFLIPVIKELENLQEEYHFKYYNSLKHDIVPL